MNIYLEPQTSISPKVKDDSVGSVKSTLMANKTLALLCAVQGYPTPNFK